MRLSSSAIESPPYTAGSRRPSMFRLTPLRTRMRTRAATLSGDEPVEGMPDVVGGDGDVDAWPVVVEEHEPELAADDLLVAPERRPRAVAVDADGLRIELLDDDVDVATRDAERGEEAERDGPAVRDALVPRRGLERVRERVPEIEHAPLSVVVRVAQAHGGLERCAAAHELVVGQLPERLAGE